jgi:hypothetical protein
MTADCVGHRTRRKAIEVSGAIEYLLDEASVIQSAGLMAPRSSRAH